MMNHKYCVIPAQAEIQVFSNFPGFQIMRRMTGFRFCCKTGIQEYETAAF